MAAELKEMKIRVTVETYVALRARAEAFDQEMSEVARKLLEEWADKKEHEHNIRDRLWKSEGLSGSRQGRSGEDEGIAGNGRESRAKVGG